MLNYSNIVTTGGAPSVDYRICHNIFVLKYVHCTVVPPITDPPRREQPLYNGQASCYG